MSSDTQYYQNCIKNNDRINGKSSYKHFMSSTREKESLIHRLRLNSLKTKYNTNVRCMCGEPISVYHLLIRCPRVTELFKESNIGCYTDGSTPLSLPRLLNDYSILDSVCKCLLSSVSILL